MVPRYAGLATFARLPRREEVPRFDVAVLGVPFDSGVSYRPGARFGPAHIRQSSRLLRPYNPALEVSPFGAQQVVDAGDLAVNPFDIGQAIAQIEAGAAGAQRGRQAAGAGRRPHHRAAGAAGDARAARQIAVLHFDAHLDTWDTYFGEPYTHGTPFRRASEEGLLDREHCLHIGIRGPLYDPADLTDSFDLGFATIALRGAGDPRRGRHHRADASPAGRPAGLRVGRHRRPGPRLRAGYRNPGSRWDEFPGAARGAARPDGCRRRFAPTSSRCRRPTTMPRSLGSPRRTSASSCCRCSPSPDPDDGAHPPLIGDEWVLLGF